MNIDRLRASLATTGQMDATDEFGNVYVGEEASAYFVGREQASGAVELLRRAGVILPNLEGFHETQDLEFKESLHDITRSLKIEPSVVYNPGCGSHVSLATAFPDARAIFTDNFVNNDPNIADELKLNGFELYKEDMHEFILPDDLKADITLILNAGHMTETELDRVVADNGIVLINNWHNGANFMIENCPGYELVEGIVSNQNVFSAQGSRDDSNMLYVFNKKEHRPQEQQTRLSVARWLIKKLSTFTDRFN